MTAIDKDEAEKLRRHGYADGNYWCKCLHCGGEFIGDKRARCCKGCAGSSEKDAEIARLTAAVRGMVAIVEGIDGAMNRGTWRDDKGTRLKDAPQWVALYNAARRKEQQG